MGHFLDFEKPLYDLEARIRELQHLSDHDDINIAEEVGNLREKAHQFLTRAYGNLTPWQKVLVARHPERPRCSYYIKKIIEEFVPLAGDRTFGEDPSILAGMGRFHGRAVMVIGNEKGSDAPSRVAHNFGMARPEGYRKSVRLMQLAQRFRLPILTMIDTPGAYPGLGAEERGQSQAIGRSIEVSLRLEVPIIAVIIGEGGSGGALALACADRVLMCEHAIYSVISPEGCASILWRDSARLREAAEALKMTAVDLQKLEVIDGIIEEPLGGAHRESDAMSQRLDKVLWETLQPFLDQDGAALVRQREEKFLAIGRNFLT